MALVRYDVIISFGLPCEVFGGFAQFHLPHVLAELQGADGLPNVLHEWAHIHKHARLQERREGIHCEDILGKGGGDNSCNFYHYYGYIPLLWLHSMVIV